MNILYKIILTALAVLGASYLIPGIVVESFYVALIVAVVLAVLNLIVKPIIILLTLPINIITLGFFTLVINAGLFWLAAYFVDGFLVERFIDAFIGALLVSVVVWVGHKFLPDND
ncbi:MAG: phage holin family protein [Candidatus Campbellbacteria bacterium]|nr:phage holin family protein [Candidatus Campbellbacteria bacterium]